MIPFNVVTGRNDMVCYSGGVTNQFYNIMLLQQKLSIDYVCNRRLLSFSFNLNSLLHLSKNQKIAELLMLHAYIFFEHRRK